MWINSTRAAEPEGEPNALYSPIQSVEQMAQNRKVYQIPKPHSFNLFFTFRYISLLTSALVLLWRLGNLDRWVFATKSSIARSFVAISPTFSVQTTKTCFHTAFAFYGRFGYLNSGIRYTLFRTCKRPDFCDLILVEFLFCRMCAWCTTLAPNEKNSVIPGVSVRGRTSSFLRSWIQCFISGFHFFDLMLSLPLALGFHSWQFKSLIIRSSSKLIKLIYLHRGA